MRGADVRVLIVGAGIAGLAAARCVRDWGATVEIVERTPGPATDGTGIYLPGNAVRALDAIGLGASVTERAVRIERQRATDHRGPVLFDVDVSALWARASRCTGRTCIRPCSPGSATCPSAGARRCVRSQHRPPATAQITRRQLVEPAVEPVLLGLSSTHQFGVDIISLTHSVSRQGLTVDSSCPYFDAITCICSKTAGQKPERATGIEPA
jgi:hypothetical protein